MKALFYLIEENILLDQVKEGDNQTILVRVIPYARVSFVSSVFSDQKRKEACISLKLIVSGSVSGDVAPAVNISSTKFALENLSFI